MLSNQKHFRRVVLSLLLLLSLSAFGPSAAPTAQGQTENVRITQVDTSNFPQVSVYLSVVDAEGQPLGINPSRIIIRENGVAIPLDQINGAEQVGPLTTLLVFDVSGSMNTAGKLQAAQAAGQAYIDQMRAGDSAGLLSFNTRVEYVQPVTTDRQALNQAIDSLVAHDDTAMYDALVQAVDILAAVDGRKAIIVLTDGLDNRSQATPEDVIARIGPAGLSISTVGLGEPGDSLVSLTALDEASLIYLAQNAGGVYGVANDQDSLRNLYESYALALQSEYVLTYTSPSSLRDGVNRALSVSLSESAVGGETVYNPGGLVPEVAEAAPWPLFFSLLAALVALLILPGVVGFAAQLLPGASAKGRKSKKKSRIKLKD
ncbi:MAG: VWA domain-containing protein [Anaerolineae bacterium]|nr:VWA domain-containing protein [Anaerolineae bacterium]